MDIAQDGLFLVTNSIDLVSGYPLAVLTPNVNEYKRLVQKVLNCEVNDRDAPELLQSLAKQWVLLSNFLKLNYEIRSILIHPSGIICVKSVLEFVLFLFFFL